MAGSVTCLEKPAGHASLGTLFEQADEISNSVIDEKRAGVSDATMIYVLI
jgi:hypothetical protein